VAGSLYLIALSKVMAPVVVSVRFADWICWTIWAGSTLLGSALAVKVDPGAV